MGQKQVLWTGLDLILIYQCFIALTPTNLNLCYGLSLFHPLPASKKRSQFNWEAVQSPVNLQTKSKYKQSVANNIATKLYIYIYKPDSHKCFLFLCCYMLLKVAASLWRSAAKKKKCFYDLEFR